MKEMTGQRSSSCRCTTHSGWGRRCGGVEVAVWVLADGPRGEAEVVLLGLRGRLLLLLLGNDVPAPGGGPPHPDDPLRLLLQRLVLVRTLHRATVLAEAGLYRLGPGDLQSGGQLCHHRGHAAHQLQTEN